MIIAAGDYSRDWRGFMLWAGAIALEKSLSRISYSLHPPTPGVLGELLWSQNLLLERKFSKPTEVAPQKNRTDSLMKSSESVLLCCEYLCCSEVVVWLVVTLRKSLFEPGVTEDVN